MPGQSGRESAGGYRSCDCGIGQSERGAAAFGRPYAGQRHFPGWLEGVRLAAWYNLADIFVLPSLVEPFGAVVNDALAAGCFCLVSGRCGSSCLIRQGWNGELFDPEDEERLASLLREACRNRGVRPSFPHLKECLMPAGFREYVNHLMEHMGL